MIHELRAYWANPGKLDALNARFRTHTIRLFTKHGITVVAFWTPDDREQHGDLIYVLGYPSREERERRFGAFAADPEWLAAKAASEVEGKLVGKITSDFLTPTDYSPMQ